MSSVIGHTLAGLSVYLSGNQPHQRLKYTKLWMGWLMFLAVAPDFDYIVPLLHPSAHDGLRVTHSLPAALLLPIVTISIFFTLGYRGRWLFHFSLLAMLSSFSHIALDTLVGVRSLPMFWPFSEEVFTLPFGILPSRGAIFLSNYYLYHNLFIELGVLLPLFGITLLLTTYRQSRRSTWAIPLLLTLCLLATSIYFMQWASGLTR